MVKGSWEWDERWLERSDLPTNNHIKTQTNQWSPKAPKQKMQKKNTTKQDKQTQFVGKYASRMGPMV